MKLAKAAAWLAILEKLKVLETWEMLKEGANIGVSGERRWASAGPNSSKVYNLCSRVADSLQTAVKDGSCMVLSGLTRFPGRTIK